MPYLDTMMVTAFCLTLVWGAAHDVATRTIPNAVSLVAAALGIVHAALAGTLIETIAISCLVFLLGVCAWRASLIGGGDVKLMSAVSLWLKPHSEPALFVAIAVFGGVVACLYLLLGAIVPVRHSARPRTLLQRAIRVERRRIERRGPIPYAVAISSAAILCLAQE